MESLTILAAALAPAVVLFYYIYRKDKFQKEPVKELLKAFGLGVLSIFVSLMISIPLGKFGFYVDDPVTFWGAVADSFFGAAIPEEIAKFLMFWLLIRNSRYFNEHMDGIVYASCVALGFAAFENILYLFMNYEDWVSVGIMRALFAVPGHFFDGILMGYYYSLVRFDPLTPRRNRYLVLVAPILAHGIYNTLLSMVNIGPFASLLIMILFLFFCNSLRKRCSRKIEEHLKNDGVVKA